MSNSDQTIILSRKTLLSIMAVGIGLLTISYVLGVQVGKQSVVAKRSMNDDVEESLKKLPASIHDQIKAIENQIGGEALETQRSEQGTAVSSVDRQMPDIKQDHVKDNVKKDNLITAIKQNLKAVQEVTNKKKTENIAVWTIQLISTPDLAEAKRTVNKAQASGFSASVISEKGLYKVRLTKAGNRELIDSTIAKLKNRGFKPFAIKI